MGPTRGGTTLNINGTRFGNTIAGTVVTIDGVSCTVTSVTNSLI